MSTKKEVQELLRTLGELVEHLPHAQQGDGYETHRALERLTGELRRELHELKLSNETMAKSLQASQAKASTAAQQAAQQIAQLQATVHSLEQQLRATKAAMKEAVEKAEAKIKHYAEDSIGIQVQEYLDHLVAPDDQPPSTEEEREERRKQMMRVVESKLPPLAKKVRSQADLLAISQDSLAKDYHVDEIIMVGLIVKYAGEYGVPVLFPDRAGKALRRLQFAGRFGKG